MKRKLVIAMWLGMVAWGVHAAEETLDETIVTATRAEQPTSQSLAHTTVITQKEIQESQVADVPALLKRLAGVEIYQAGGLGKQSSVFMRGTNSNHTLVLLDGVRISSATTGMTAIDQIMLDQVERIEVVRGNVSSLYGSEGIGGVIQIFSKRGKGAPSFSGNVSTGSYGTKRYSAGVGGESGNTSFDLRTSKLWSQGISAIDPAVVPSVNPDTDGYDNKSFSGNLRHQFKPGHSYSMSVFNSTGQVQTDNSFGLATDVNGSQSHVRKVTLALEDHFTDAWVSTLQRGQGLDETLNFLNGQPDLALGAQFMTLNEQLSWQNNVRLSDRAMLNFGVERLKQVVTSSTAYTRADRSDNSVFAGYTHVLGTQQIQANVRRDTYSDFGDARTFLLGYGIDLDGAWRLTGDVSTGFKAPTLNDLFYPFVNYGGGFSYQGNPNLLPERSRNAEFGLHYVTDSQRMVLTHFDNHISDLIAITPQAASTMANLNQARIDGWELSYVLRSGDMGVDLSLTQQNPRDTQTNQLLLRRAQSFSNVALTQRNGAWTLGTEWQHVGTRDDLDINTFARTTLASYNLVNLTARYPLDKRLELTVRLDNLLDSHYVAAHGYSTMGRAVYTGLLYR